MTNKMIAGAALAGLVLAGGVAGMVSAQSVADATNLTEDQVIALALLEVSGEVTEIELEDHRGIQFYEVEVIAADGAEMEIEIDAQTGEILKVAEDGDGCDDDDDEDEA